MKVDEAPTKIYVSNYSSGLTYNWHKRLAVNDIEYTRTDAFIEKAVEWIDKNAFRYIVTRKYQGLDVTGLDASLAADFKKALEDIL